MAGISWSTNEMEAERTRTNQEPKEEGTQSGDETQKRHIEEFGAENKSFMETHFSCEVLLKEMVHSHLLHSPFQPWL